MKKQYQEVIDLEDRTITITHHTGYWTMFFNTVIKPFLHPLIEMGYDIKYKAAVALVYAIFAYFQNLFEPETVVNLLQVPVGLIEGLSIIVGLDFVAGTIRAISDSRIRFHPKKFAKTFNKVVFYCVGIGAITVGANMFPTALGWLQYVAFLAATGNEIWSVLKHCKLTALILVGIEVYKNKGNLFNLDFQDLKKRVDNKSAQEFAESQSYFFGDEDVQVTPKPPKGESNGL